MNILFVHEVDWLNKVVFEIHNLAEGLARLGHRVFAIDYEDNWRENGRRWRGSLKTKDFKAVSRVFEGASVELRRPGFIPVPVLSRLSAGLTHYAVIKRTLREERIDAVVLYSVPTNGLQTVRLARKAGIPVVFRSIDILHHLVRYGVLRSPTKVLEKMVYRRVDSILAITPHHARYVTGMGADASKVKVLPLPVDTALFSPSTDTLEVRRKWGFGEKDTIIVFIGTLFPFSGLDDFICDFPPVLDEFPEARLLIVGDGPQRPLLEKIISKLGLQENVIITGFEPYHLMPQYINLATVCINPFLNTENTRDIFPGKIIQYLACGRPAVATPLLGIKSLIADESGGVVYADNAAGMVKEVIDLLKSGEKGEHIGRAGLEYVRRNHDHQGIVRRLEEELIRVTKR